MSVNGSTRDGYTVGRSTVESNYIDQLKKYKLRVSPDGGVTVPTKPLNPSHETLSNKCIDVIVANFERRPLPRSMPPSILRQVVARLPLTLNVLIATQHVSDEAYWKRRCVDAHGWHGCDLSEHGMSWKQLYLERHVQSVLEDFDAKTGSMEELIYTIDVCRDYIFTLTIHQLLSHIDLSLITARLPNLTALRVTYGVKRVGMNYESMLFGMKISDATGLARCLSETRSLTVLSLQSCLIDDDLLRMLMTGLIANTTLVQLDLSHNKITNHGARLLAKLLGENSSLAMLDVSDNQIHAEGGRYLGRGLRANSSLVRLNLRLNRLTDDGGRLLLEGMQDNVSLVQLNLGSNSIGYESTQVLGALLRDSGHAIETVDLAGNALTADDISFLHLSIERNNSLCSIDLRCNPGYAAATEAIEAINSIVRRNETALSTASSRTFGGSSSSAGAGASDQDSLSSAGAGGRHK